MKKCPKCGYERTQKDEAFISAAECPKCGVFYEKEKAYVAKKKEMAEAEQLNVAEEEKRREEERLIAESQKGETQIADEKKCKYCAMMIPKEAKICPHCRKKIPTSGITGLVIIIIFVFII